MKCLPCKVISVVIQHHCSAWRRENLPEHIRSDQNTWFLRQQPKCPATPESIFSCFKIAIPHARISPKCQCTEHSSFCRHTVFSFHLFYSLRWLPLVHTSWLWQLRRHELRTPFRWFNVANPKVLVVFYMVTIGTIYFITFSSKVW